MAKPINVLLVEDSTDDAELLIAEMRRAHFEPKWTRVETEADFMVEIQKLPEIILADYSMPRFNGLRAVQLLRKHNLDIPFILVSGTMGEDVAVEAMKQGADDYLLKDRTARLGVAVAHALKRKLLRDERQRTENELRWRTAFFDAQMRSTPDGIQVVDSQQKRILENQRLIELFNVPPEIAANKDDALLLRHLTTQMKNPAAFLDRVEYLYARPDEIGVDEIELTDGRILNRYSSPVRDQGGNYFGRIWSFRDITQQRKMEEQFRQSQKMEAFGQLASGVAHDFNNILAVIQMLAGLLRAEENLSPKQLEYAGEIQRNSQRAANLTRQLLMFSRKQTMQLNDLNLNGIVANITKMLHRVLGEHIQMQLKYAAQPLLIHADAGMVDQILMNLAVNSRDAMPKGGQLVIETSAVEIDEVTAAQSTRARPGSFVCLSVSDTGEGIPGEILPRIFEPFFTTKDVGKGTGLGLATLFGIVEQHQGWVDVESKVGEGTMFKIYLPRLISPANAVTTQPNLGLLTGGRETILVVEDDDALREVVRSALQLLGYRVFEASSGLHALEVWKQHRDEIHLLLTDMVMPNGINGKELAAQLLQKRPRLKVIYTSGYSADVAGSDFPLDEDFNFLAKPFEMHKLARILRLRLESRS